MLLTHVLATDPATPADVLTYLSERHDANALTLAVHPNFPPDAPLHPRTIRRTELHDALTHPDLPAHRRSTFINATGPDELIATIGEWDCFTPDELTQAHTRTPATSPDLDDALLRNTHTPRDIAAQIVASRPGTTIRERALFDAATITHRLEPRNYATRHALAQPDPALAYAEHLGEHGWHGLDGLTPSTAAAWWAATLEFNHHPHLVRLALKHATLATSLDVCGRIRWAIDTNTRVAPELRRAAQRPHASDGHEPPHNTRTATAVAWRRTDVTAADLRALLEDVPHYADSDGSYVTAVALHPASTPDLRADALTALMRHGHVVAFKDLIERLIAPGPAASAALDVPYLDLTDPQSDDPSAYPTMQIPHVKHWARLAWASAQRPTTTLEYAYALHALADASFPGTLRELLTTAATIARPR